MGKNIVDKFIGALSELESSRDVEMLVALFDDNCEIGNVFVSEKFRGIAEARRFWTNYRATFKDVCSIFQKEIYSGNDAALEWITEGKCKDGRKIKYESLGILETNGEKITRFCTYFDPQNLGQITKHNGGSGTPDRIF